MLIREITEDIEQKTLSQYAVKSINTKGRNEYEQKCDIRTEFQRDRDRIIHSKAFRRLKHKTQVFISPEGDHYRTRLTHTLEVSQIARTIARALRLNEDLTEAISLGHDLGHTPFGHSGELVLNNLYSLGFKHNEQSLRVVEVLENRKGLNLTQEVKDGIVNHTGNRMPNTLEGAVVRVSDRIAYINHDIDDAIRANIVNIEELPKEYIKVLGNSHKDRINTMILDIIDKSLNRPFIKMSDEIECATNGLRDFLFKNIYTGSEAKKEEIKVQYILKALYSHLIEEPNEIINNMMESLPEEDIHRIVCDYIAGMTDRYALNKYKSIFIPLSWQFL
ncbi:MAG: deoxyguanosinetriphosphate triphosphohydrolase [Firmicutes bacterium]|nr:deoxyguanosinetriphosphate triphosphohydrolase [Bacillota bacterium]